MTKEQIFDNWWETIGSGIRPSECDDRESHTYRVARQVITDVFPLLISHSESLTKTDLFAKWMLSTDYKSVIDSLREQLIRLTDSPSQSISGVCQCNSGDYINEVAKRSDGLWYCGNCNKQI